MQKFNFFEVKMIFCVKNELATLFDGVRFAVSSCLENSVNAHIDRDRAEVVSISLAGKVASGRSIDFSGKVWSGLCFRVVATAEKFCKVVEIMDSKLVLVVEGLVRKTRRYIASHWNLLEYHFSKRTVFKRQAVLACAGGLRL